MRVWDDGDVDVIRFHYLQSGVRGMGLWDDILNEWGARVNALIQHTHSLQALYIIKDGILAEAEDEELMRALQRYALR